MLPKDDLKELNYAYIHLELDTQYYIVIGGKINEIFVLQ